MEDPIKPILEIIETKNAELRDWIFLREITSDFDVERKLEISSKINELQRSIDLLTADQEESARGTLSMLEVMFNQATAPIQNGYTNVIASPESNNFAPNGDKSLLSTPLFALTRSEEFKNWFGDWVVAANFRGIEGAELNVSKIINKNGEPQLVWHGTGQEFSYFKFDRFPAAYFAENQEYSKWFADLHGEGKGGYTIPFFLNIKNPIDLTRFGTKEIDGKTFFDEIFLQTGMNEVQLGIRELFLDKKTPPLESWVFIRNNPAMLKAIQESGVADGIIFYESNPSAPAGNDKVKKTKAYIIFDPHQAKIADPNRGTLLLAHFRSFQLKKGGRI